MSKQEHKYAQVLRWIADGERIQHWCIDEISAKKKWRDCDNEKLIEFASKGTLDDCLSNFRLAPRTVTVNGVECVAPETVAPAYGATIYVANPLGGNWYAGSWWNRCQAHEMQLARGLVFLCQEHAVAYAKAMCNYKEV